MKLRIRANSIRLRLSQSEVASLGAGHAVEQTTEFSPTSKLTYRIETGDTNPLPDATFIANCIQIVIPRAQALHWATTDTVGIEADQPIAHDRMLNILIEKDFECIHARDEQDADAFPNPKQS